MSWCLDAARFGFQTFPIALKFNKHRGSGSVERHVKVQNYTIIITSNLAASRFHEIWRSDVLPLIITLVRHKKARFDSKMHGSTEKSPVRQKNARFDRKMPSPECISWHCHYQTSPPPSSEKYFFPFFSHIFLRTNREMKIKLFWY